MTKKLERVEELEIVRIVPGDNDRTEFSATEIQELADSIEAHGLVQPITVRVIGRMCLSCGAKFSYHTHPADTKIKCPWHDEPLDVVEYYQIVAGERRFRAHKHLARTTIKAIVRELDDTAASDIMLIENVNRVDLNPLDEARAYEKRGHNLRIEMLGRGETVTEKLENEAVAAKVGKSPQYVAERRSLLKLVDEVQFQLKTGAFPIGHALLMVKLDTNRQRMALTYYNKSGKMAQVLFKELCQQLYDAQVEEQQQGLMMFDLAMWDRIAEDTANMPLRGKKAVILAPKRTDLPKMVNERRDEKAGDVVEKWIASLEAAGLHEEARVAGTMYESLVHLNFMQATVTGAYTSRGLESHNG